MTRSSRQTPNPATMEQPRGELAVFSGAVHAPRRSFCPGGQERHEDALGPEQVAHFESQELHFALDESKNSSDAHVETHDWNGVKTGRDAGQVRHEVDVGPVQVSQSGWHARHAEALLNVRGAEVET